MTSTFERWLMKSIARQRGNWDVTPPSHGRHTGKDRQMEIFKQNNDHAPAKLGWEEEYKALPAQQQAKVRHCASVFRVPLIAAYLRARDLGLLSETTD